MARRQSCQVYVIRAGKGENRMCRSPIPRALTLLPAVLVTLLGACGGGGPEAVVVTEIYEPAADDEPWQPDEVIIEVTATPQPATPLPPALALATIDAALAISMQGSVAHNAPSQMVIDDLVEIQLLVSPDQAMAPATLAAGISAPGPVVSDTLAITPWMRAELDCANPGAFYITAIHGDSMQLLSNLEPAEWRWTVQAREPGTHRLLLRVFRLVELDGRENWRAVESYTHQMTVNVTWSYRLARFGERLTEGLLLPALATVVGALILYAISRRYRL